MGCEPSSVAGPDTGATEDTAGTTDAASSESTAGPGVVGTFEVGWGDTEFNALADGDTLQVVWGGQGAAMFPLPLRGSEFVLPDPPDDYTSKQAPLFDLEIDIEGYNNDVGGHFRRLANYPITFTVLPDGTYEFVYVAVLLPDEIDPPVLNGMPAHLWARLRPYGSAALEVEFDLVVAAAAPD